VGEATGAGERDDKVLDIMGASTYNGLVQIIIHRNIGIPGGGCVELTTGKTRILIDPALPLESPLHTGNIDAIIMSGFRFGQCASLRNIDTGTHIFLSRAAREMIDISAIFDPSKSGVIKTSLIDERKSFAVGDIKLTPFTVGYSALYATAFLIEAEGKKLLYSIDPRGYDRKSVLYKKMIERPLKDIEVLLMEGTPILSDSDTCKNEAEAQSEIEGVLEKTHSITFLFTSPENIDRIVSAYKACIKTGSVFVVDIYTAYLLDRLRKILKHIPQFNWRNIRVKFSKDQADTLSEKVSSQLLYHYNSKKIDIFEINERKNKVLMLLSDSLALPDMVKSMDGLKGAKVIFSMPERHLTDEFTGYCRKKGLVLKHICLNGNIGDDEKKGFVRMVNPNKVIKIPDDDKTFNV
jgi:ribonuclease J